MTTTTTSSLETLDGGAESAYELICLICTELQNQIVVNDNDRIAQRSEQHTAIFDQLCCKLAIQVPTEQWDFTKEYLPFCDACLRMAEEFETLVEELGRLELGISVILEKYRMAIQESARKRDGRTNSRNRNLIVSSSPRFEHFRQQVLKNQNTEVRHISSKRVERVTGMSIRERDWDETSQCSVNSKDALSPIMAEEDERYILDNRSNTPTGSSSQRSIDLSDYASIPSVAGSARFEDFDGSIPSIPSLLERSSSLSDINLDLFDSASCSGSSSSKSTSSGQPEEVQEDIKPLIENLPQPVILSQDEINKKFIDDLIKAGTAYRPSWQEEHGETSFGLVKIRIPSGTSKRWECGYAGCNFGFENGTKKKPKACIEYHVKKAHLCLPLKPNEDNLPPLSHIGPGQCSPRKRKEPGAQRKCKGCNDVFENLSKLKIHQSLCPAKHPQISSAAPETKEDSDEDDISSGESSDEDDVPLSKRNKRKNDVPSFICNICDKNFKTKYSLGRHEQTAHNNSNTTVWQCDTCGKSLGTKDYLLEHKRHVHKQGTAIAEFKCPIENCVQSFPKKSRLERHLKSHERNTVRRVIECESFQVLSQQQISFTIAPR